jgi:hypothetical protein
MWVVRLPTECLSPDPKAELLQSVIGSQAMSRVLPLRPKQRLNPGGQVSRAQIKLERHHVPRAGSFHVAENVFLDGDR